MCGPDVGHGFGFTHFSWYAPSAGLAWPPGHPAHGSYLRVSSKRFEALWRLTVYWVREPMKFQQNAFLWLLTGCGAVALAGALAANQESGGFFVAVRVVVCFASAYAAVKAYQTKREVWTWLLGANAALYNPFVLVHLTRNIWNLVDLADIALLLAAGVALRVREEKRADLGGSGGMSPLVPAVPAKAKEYRTPSKTELAIWLLLLFLCLAGVFMSQYYAYVEGTSQSDAQSRNVGSATLGLAFWAYVIARVRRWRRPGRIALGGFVAGLVTLFVASAVGGYAKGTEMNEVLASIERFDPAVAVRLKAGTGAPLSSLMGSSLARAIDQAPDTAVLAFMRERFAIIQSDSTASLTRCTAAFNGGGDFRLNSHEQLRMMRALGNLYSAAASEHRTSTTDAERSAAVASLTAAYQKIDPTGILDNEEKRKTLSETEQCGMYTRLMNELQSMPPKEGAAAIRAMTAG